MFRFDNQQLIPTKYIFGVGNFGVLYDNVPISGENGASVLLNDGGVNGDSVRLRIVSIDPTITSLIVYENGAFESQGTGQWTYYDSVNGVEGVTLNTVTIHPFGSAHNVSVVDSLPSLLSTVTLSALAIGLGNDTYTLNDGYCYAGMFNGITGIAQGGTVSALAADVSASGFTLLTTAPDTSIYRNQPHAGMAWDDTGKAAWIFGAETHSNPSDYDNSVYCFDTTDGLFKKMYNQSPWPAEYNIDADGYLWADDAGTLPWAAHTYRRLQYEPNIKSLVFYMDTEFHSYTTPIQKGDTTLVNRKKPKWLFNTVTKTWSTEYSLDIQSFVGSGASSAIGYHPDYGYIQCQSPNFRILSNEGVLSTTNVFNNSNTQYHDNGFVIGEFFYKFGGHASVFLFSRHLLSDPTSTLIKMVDDFPVLTDWSINNKSSVAMSDGNILFIAERGTDLGAFIYDTLADSVIDTGYRLANFTRPTGSYDFKMAWSNSLNAAVYLTAMYGTVRAYLLRI